MGRESSESKRLKKDSSTSSASKRSRKDSGASKKSIEKGDHSSKQRSSLDRYRNRAAIINPNFRKPNRPSSKEIEQSTDVREQKLQPKVHFAEDSSSTDSMEIGIDQSSQEKDQTTAHREIQISNQVGTSGSRVGELWDSYNPEITGTIPNPKPAGKGLRFLRRLEAKFNPGRAAAYYHKTGEKAVERSRKQSRLAEIEEYGKRARDFIQSYIAYCSEEVKKSLDDLHKRSCKKRIGTLKGPKGSNHEQRYGAQDAFKETNEQFMGMADQLKQYLYDKYNQDSQDIHKFFQQNQNCLSQLSLDVFNKAFLHESQMTYLFVPDHTHEETNNILKNAIQHTEFLKSMRDFEDVKVFHIKQMQPIYQEKAQEKIQELLEPIDKLMNQYVSMTDTQQRNRIQKEFIHRVNALKIGRQNLEKALRDLHMNNHGLES